MITSLPLTRGNVIQPTTDDKRLHLAKYTGGSSGSYRNTQATNIYEHEPNIIITALVLEQTPQLYKSNLMRKASVVISAMGWNHRCKNTCLSITFIQQGCWSSDLLQGKT
jgi:hypothetical protein